MEYEAPKPLADHLLTILPSAGGRERKSGPSVMGEREKTKGGSSRQAKVSVTKVSAFSPWGSAGQAARPQLSVQAFLAANVTLFQVHGAGYLEGSPDCRSAWDLAVFSLQGGSFLTDSPSNALCQVTAVCHGDHPPPQLLSLIPKGHILSSQPCPPGPISP